MRPVSNHNNLTYWLGRHALKGNVVLQGTGSSNYKTCREHTEFVGTRNDTHKYHTSADRHRLLCHILERDEASRIITGTKHTHTHTHAQTKTSDRGGARVYLPSTGKSHRDAESTSCWGSARATLCQSCTAPTPTAASTRGTETPCCCRR